MTRLLRYFCLLTLLFIASGSIFAQRSDVRNRAIKLGVMLPLHNINGDGRRMVEYYRGVLMACDSLRKKGISVDVNAWNVPENGDINQTLFEPAAAQCDLIFGPLYSKQVHALSEFVTRHDIKLVIPFSITCPELLTNRNIFQVYQSPTAQNESIFQKFLDRFDGYHPVFIDCNDSTSQKGAFTSGLRRRLEAKGIDYSITNLRSPDANFQNAFSTDMPNIVVLNTGRSPELGSVISRLNRLTAANKQLEVMLFGYTEWMMYTKNYQYDFYKYNAYIPAPYFMNPLSSQTSRFEQHYRWNFHQNMMQTLPRFAMTGFDHAVFFLMGLHKYGKNFDGAAGSFGYAPVQTPLQFERMGNGGLQNRSMVFVHYMPEHRMETISF